MKWYKFFLIIFVISIIICALNMTYTDILKNLPANMRTTVEKFNDNNKVNICLFHASWCGHCRTYKEKGTFMNTYNNEILANPKLDNIIFLEYDFDQNKNLATKYNINSFPTIVSIDNNGELIETFSGNRDNSKELVDFAIKNAK